MKKVTGEFWDSRTLAKFRDGTVWLTEFVTLTS